MALDAGPTSIVSLMRIRPVSRPALGYTGSFGNCTAGDVTDNGVVDVDDLLTVINAWGGVCAPFCPADLAPAPVVDGVVNVDDLLEVINNWG